MSSRRTETAIIFSMRVGWEFLVIKKRTPVKSVIVLRVDYIRMAKVIIEIVAGRLFKN